MVLISVGCEGGAESGGKERQIRGRPFHPRCTVDFPPPRIMILIYGLIIAWLPGTSSGRFLFARLRVQHL
jgi:hypothetical protein